MKPVTRTYPVDLSGLPETLQKKVYAVYDRYFGFGLMSKAQAPTDKPNLPSQISSLTSAQIADLHGLYSAWLSYAGDKLKFVTAACTILEKELSVTYNLAFASLDTKGNLEQRKAAAKTGEDYLLVEQYLEELKALKGMLTTESELLDKQLMTVRAELRRRENTNNY